MIYHYQDADALPTCYGTTANDHNQAVDAMRLTGGFLRDTYNDCLNADAADNRVRQITHATLELEADDSDQASALRSDIWVFVSRAASAADAQDWPVASVAICGAAHALNLLHAVTDAHAHEATADER